jgi:ADP-L-glycero-D-manno-heptose 6-epimerase
MIIVTGGAGFIGSALLWRLNQEKITDIVVVDRLGSQNKWKNLRKKQFSCFVHRDQLFSWIEEKKPVIDGIFHMGACSRTTEMDADFLMENNVNYSIRLFELARAHNAPFIYASSAATYGGEEHNFSDNESEIERLMPINKYGFSKHLFDLWVLRQRNVTNFWAGLKFFNVYGPNEYHKESQASVAFHAFNQVRESGSIRLFKSYRPHTADGEQKRDFVYIKDVVDVMLHLYSSRLSSTQSGLYNIGTGRARSFAELAKAIFASMKIAKPNIVWIDMPSTLRDQYQYFTEAEINKLKTVAGYTKPFHSIEEGVQDYVCNYLQQHDSYL